MIPTDHIRQERLSIKNLVPALDIYMTINIKFHDIAIYLYAISLYNVLVGITEMYSGTYLASLK